MDESQLRALCALHPVTVPDATLAPSARIEDILWQLLAVPVLPAAAHAQARAAAELLASAAPAALPPAPPQAAQAPAARVHPSVVANAVERAGGSWFELARHTARRDPTVICYVIFAILRSKPGLLAPCSGLRLFLRLYVPPTDAVEYVRKILIRSAEPFLAEEFTRVADAVCASAAVLMRVGLCDNLIQCEACAAAPGACRLYSLLPLVSPSDLFAVCVKFGLARLAARCIAQAAPTVETVDCLFKNMLCAAQRCGTADVSLLLRDALDGAHAAGFCVDEARIARLVLDRIVMRDVSAVARMSFVRELSQRPSWSTQQLAAAAIDRLRKTRPGTSTDDFLRSHLFPFLTQLAPVYNADLAPPTRRVLRRIDADHTLERMLRVAGPLVGPAEAAMEQVFYPIIDAMEL